MNILFFLVKVLKYSEKKNVSIEVNIIFQNKIYFALM